MTSTSTVRVNTERAAAIGGPATGWFLPEELTQLAIWAQHHERIVELGSHVGQSARAFGDNTSGVVFSVDNWKGSYNGIDDRLNRFCENCSDLIASRKIIIEKNDHVEFERTFLSFGSGAFVPDLVFIDGDHQHASVKRDMKWALSVVVPGGLICGHDVEIPDVRRALDEMLPDWTRPCGYLWQAVKA